MERHPADHPPPPDHTRTLFPPALTFPPLPRPLSHNPSTFDSSPPALASPPSPSYLSLSSSKLFFTPRCPPPFNSLLVSHHPPIVPPTHPTTFALYPRVHPDPCSTPPTQGLAWRRRGSTGACTGGSGKAGGRCCWLACPRRV